MNLVKCRNGHFYDSSIYDACPHCQQQAMDEGRTVAMQSPGEQLTEPLTGNENSYMPQERVEQVQSNGNDERNSEPDGQRTVGYYSKSVGKDPVTGWLVCVTGECKGESFNLKSGRNFIGRSSAMDVVLDGDRSVSRNKHAILVYEPKAHVFIAQPGESRELFYVNDEVVLSNVVLKAYDKLTIGETELLFVPFCGERFSW